MVTLNMDMEVSHNMMRMYDYMMRQLIQANVKNELQLLDEVEGYLVEFRDTWKEVIQQTRQKNFQQGGQA